MAEEHGQRGKQQPEQQQQLATCTLFSSYKTQESHIVIN